MYIYVIDTSSIDHQVWGLAPCPSDRGLFASVHTRAPNQKAQQAGFAAPLDGSIFKMLDIDEDVVTTLSSPLERIARLRCAPHRHCFRVLLHTHTHTHTHTV